MSTAGSVTAVGVEMRGRWWQERRLVALEITARVDVPSRCRVALKSALPHFLWRNYPETGKFRRDSCEFEEALVAGQRCCSSKR